MKNRIEPPEAWPRPAEMKCTIERDRLGRVIYRAGDGVGVYGSGPLDWLSENAVTPHTKLFHFFVIGDYIEEDDDYVILESIGKGTAVGRLSWYAGKQYTVFRMNDPDYVALGKLAAERASIFGRRHYDYALYLKLFTWAAGYWTKELATGHFPPRAVRTDQIPYKTDHDFICIELYFAIWNLVGRRIRAHGHAPMPAEVINAVKRGTLVVIDSHDGNKSAWRTPRGKAGLSWVELGKAAEHIEPGDLLALGSDGLVRKAVEPFQATDPESFIKGRIAEERMKEVDAEITEPEIHHIPPVSHDPGPALTGRQGGQSRNRVHLYLQPFGYPIRACDWNAVDRESIEKAEEFSVPNPAAGTVVITLAARGGTGDRICKLCQEIAAGRRASMGSVNHGHGKGAPTP